MEEETPVTGFLELELQNLANILKEEYLIEEIFMSPLNADKHLEDFEVVF